MNIIEQIKSIHWPATGAFMAIRIGVASVVWVALMLATGGPQASLMLIIVMPLALLAMTVMAVAAGLLSQVGVPFAGLVSHGFALPVWIADPLVWLLFKAKPEWSPVAELKVFNPAVVLVHQN